MKEVERRLHYVEMKKEWYAGNYEDHGYVSCRRMESERVKFHEQALTNFVREMAFLLSLSTVCVICLRLY